MKKVELKGIGTAVVLGCSRKNSRQYAVLTAKCRSNGLDYESENIVFARFIL